MQTHELQNKLAPEESEIQNRRRIQQTGKSGASLVEGERRGPGQDDVSPKSGLCRQQKKRQLQTARQKCEQVDLARPTFLCGEKTTRDMQKVPIGRPRLQSKSLNSLSDEECGSKRSCLRCRRSTILYAQAGIEQTPKLSSVPSPMVVCLLSSLTSKRNIFTFMTKV